MIGGWRLVSGILLLVAWLPAGVAAPARHPGPQGLVEVETVPELLAAVDTASPGDVIRIAPGTYDVGGNVVCDEPGAPATGPVHFPRWRESPPTSS